MKNETTKTGFQKGSAQGVAVTLQKNYYELNFFKILKRIKLSFYVPNVLFSEGILPQPLS